VSEENVKLVREIYKSFNRGDITRALDAFDPKVEWSITPEAGPAPGSYSGHEGVRDAMGSMLEVWSDYQSEPLEYIENGEFVVVRLCAHGIGRASGIQVEDEVAHLWRIKDGKIVRFAAYIDSSDALATIKAERGL
jgi:uncharacterized protein